MNHIFLVIIQKSHQKYQLINNLTYNYTRLDDILLGSVPYLLLFLSVPSVLSLYGLAVSLVKGFTLELIVEEVADFLDFLLLEVYFGFYRLSFEILVEHQVFNFIASKLNFWDGLHETFKLTHVKPPVVDEDIVDDHFQVLVNHHDFFVEHAIKFWKFWVTAQIISADRVGEDTNRGKQNAHLIDDPKNLN